MHSRVLKTMSKVNSFISNPDPLTLTKLRMLPAKPYPRTQGNKKIQIFPKRTQICFNSFLVQSKGRMLPECIKKSHLSYLVALKSKLVVKLVATRSPNQMVIPAGMYSTCVEYLAEPVLETVLLILKV